MWGGCRCGLAVLEAFRQTESPPSETATMPNRVSTSAREASVYGTSPLIYKLSVYRPGSRARRLGMTRLHLRPKHHKTQEARLRIYPNKNPFSVPGTLGRSIRRWPAETGASSSFLGRRSGDGATVGTLLDVFTNHPARSPCLGASASAGGFLCGWRQPGNAPPPSRPVGSGWVRLGS
jgi:hypothetical protein